MDEILTLRVPDDVIRRLNEMAVTDGVSRSLLVRRMILTELGLREAA